MSKSEKQNIKLEKVDDKTAYENLLIKYAELENKIADIKANCDLAIEGRDIKIQELEKNLKLWTDTKDARETIFFQQKRKIAELEKENAELKKEVEKHKWNDIFLEDCAGYDKKIAEEYTTLQERIEKLEKENKTLEGCLLAEQEHTQMLEQQIEKMQEKLKADLIADLKERIQYSTSPSCTKGMELFIRSIEEWEIKENE